MRRTTERLRTHASAYFTAVLIALAFAWSGGAAQAYHIHLPGTPPHSHGEPGSAGDVLAKRLERRLANEASVVDGGYKQGLSAHGQGEGLPLSGLKVVESVVAGPACDPDAPFRHYDVAAINVEITLNRFLDYDPDGRMYVLEQDIERVRQEEARNRIARYDLAGPAVSIGLDGDAIQPLTIRANQGDCVSIALRNGLKGSEPASLHIHGSSLYVAATGEPAIATNLDASVLPGETVRYEWMVADDAQEGVHYFHSHGVERFQAGHGLFGAIVIEQHGASYLDPVVGEPLESGWSAIIQHPGGSDFREFVVYYHEIGSERYRHLDKTGERVTLTDPLSGAYKPGGRALNYRSEPFMNRLRLQTERFDAADQSLAYSSYTFGDPATPIAKSYLGDPVKTRVVHGGSEVFHVHHTHGGGIRWRRQPGTDDTSFDTGLDKSPPLKTGASTRLDSQSIGPSQSFDLESECGSGGCQQSPGDYLVHCHVAHHYIAGMWMIWRVHNTLQTGDGSGALMELPDRRGGTPEAVTSEGLLGRSFEWKGEPVEITSENLGDWVERQLPPPGLPRGYDASVFNWHRQGDLYLNEPETELTWPGYEPESPGIRPPILFDPTTGKLAYPLLRPHLGERPPFAPNHGPAPFLSPEHNGRPPPLPGESGARSLCPAGTSLQEYVVHAINVPIVLNEDASLIDPVGQLYVLKEDEEAVRASSDLRVPLALRANAGEDCVDLVFKSELEDTAENIFFSKASIHVHLVQFDVQATDGISTGFAYEQSVRPFTVEGEALRAGAEQGSLEIELASAGRFRRGALVGVGMDQDETFEIKRIASIAGSRLVFDSPLEHPHEAGEIVSTEFVRYRWYPDVQFGTAYFHDHVNALVSWKHGLFGALISEPPGSTYHDPFTGASARSGTIVDIHTESAISPDVTGSFRELVMFIQDNNLATHIDRSSGSAFNLHASPPESRGRDPTLWFSSEVHGDPDTPILNAYLGDPVVVRALVSSMNDAHTWHIDGHWFRRERFSPDSRPVSTVHIGISERSDLIIPAAGGPQMMPGDYPYYNGRTFRLREGSWGLLRVHREDSTLGLLKLPGRETIPSPPDSVCPADAPVKDFAVAAVPARLPMLGGGMGKMFALEADADAFVSGSREPEPLVLRVGVGDCVKVRLTNRLEQGRVSFHADMLAYDPRESLGIAAGFNPDQSVAPGDRRTYTFFAHPEYGEGPALVRDWGNVLVNPGLGLYGAIVVAPAGAAFTHPETGEDVSLASSWRADVHLPDGSGYRDFALFLQDEDEVIGTHAMPYNHAVSGVVGLNYRSSPLDGRFDLVPGQNVGIGQLLIALEEAEGLFDLVPEEVATSDAGVYASPSTPVMEAYAGDPVRIQVMVPFSEQNHVFSIEGHRWPFEPEMQGTDLVSSEQVGAVGRLEILLDAGGPSGMPGDYLYGDHRLPYREAGLWGLFRVLRPGDENSAIIALGGR